LKIINLNILKQLLNQWIKYKQLKNNQKNYNIKLLKKQENFLKYMMKWCQMEVHIKKEQKIYLIKKENSNLLPINN